MMLVGELACPPLGKSFLHYAVDPFLSGVYAGDPMNSSLVMRSRSSTTWNSNTGASSAEPSRKPSSRKQIATVSPARKYFQPPEDWTN